LTTKNLSISTDITLNKTTVYGYLTFYGTEIGDLDLCTMGDAGWLPAELGAKSQCTTEKC
jgi:hypothetical protein